MIQNNSTVYEHTIRKVNSPAYITKIYHEVKQLPSGIFVLERNFSHVHFSNKLEMLRIVLYEIFDRLSDVTCEFLLQDGSTFDIHKKHLLPLYLKEPLLYPHLRNFMRFLDSTHTDIAKPIKYANSDSSPSHNDSTSHSPPATTSIYDSTNISQMTAHLSKYMTTHRSETSKNSLSSVRLQHQLHLVHILSLHLYTFITTTFRMELNNNF